MQTIVQNFPVHWHRMETVAMAETAETAAADGSGGTDAELTATAAASAKDAGSKSKSAVSTADESPIGTMSVLAALSLLAGGYVVVRKRKKEEI